MYINTDPTSLGVGDSYIVALDSMAATNLFHIDCAKHCQERNILNDLHMPDADMDIPQVFHNGYFFYLYTAQHASLSIVTYRWACASN